MKENVYEQYLKTKVFQEKREAILSRDVLDDCVQLAQEFFNEVDEINVDIPFVSLSRNGKRFKVFCNDRFQVEVYDDVDTFEEREMLNSMSSIKNVYTGMYDLIVDQYNYRTKTFRKLEDVVDYVRKY